MYVVIVLHYKWPKFMYSFRDNNFLFNYIGTFHYYINNNCFYWFNAWNEDVIIINIVDTHISINHLLLSRVYAGTYAANEKKNIYIIILYLS